MLHFQVFMFIGVVHNLSIVMVNSSQSHKVNRLFQFYEAGA